MIDSNLCLGYYRVSTSRQAEMGHAMERYREQLLKYGLKDDQIFWDIESGGKDDREGYNKILDLIKTGYYSVLIVPCFDRFTRSSLGWETAMQELQSRGVLLKFADGGELHLQTPEDMYLSRILAAQANMVRDRNKFNALQGHKHYRSKNKPYIAAFGYIKDIKRERLLLNYSPYKDTGKTYYQIARELIETFIEYGSLSKTCRKMCDRYGFERISTAKHEDFPRDHTALGSWLRCGQIRGEIVYFTKKKDEDKQTKIAGQHPAIITPQEDEIICNLLIKNSKLKGKQDECRNPLAGLCFCAGCGSSMYHKDSRSEVKTWHYLICKGAYPVAGHQRICDRRSSYSIVIQDAIAAVIEALCQKSEEISILGVAIESPQESPKVLELKAAIDRLEKIGDPDLVEAIQLKKDKLANLLKTQVLEDKSCDRARKKLREFGSNPTFWRFMSIKEQKIVFYEFVERVDFDKGQITVKLKI